MNLLPYWNTAISLEQYMSDMKTVIDTESAGDLTKFYGINYQRMRRLEKKIALSPEETLEIKNIKKPLNLLIITEGWCGDAAQIIPVIKKMVDASDDLSFKLIYRDLNLDLMNQYLTNGAQSIPIVLGMNMQGESRFRWGPRPIFGMDLLKQYKDGTLSKDDFAISLQKTYNKDKGQSIIHELLEKFRNA
ncbi:thioredoxin family protein [Flavobacteriaceae bacterium Ap0902]|nr:thioredoxin family protein [Flavobacteriaceae bacterium Ap0902]